MPSLAAFFDSAICSSQAVTRFPPGPSGRLGWNKSLLHFVIGSFSSRIAEWLSIFVSKIDLRNNYNYDFLNLQWRAHPLAKTNKKSARFAKNQYKQQVDIVLFRTITLFFPSTNHLPITIINRTFHISWNNKLLLPPLSRNRWSVCSSPCFRRSCNARRTVDSDSFKSRAIVGIAGQQTPFLLARSAR